MRRPAACATSVLPSPVFISAILAFVEHLTAHDLHVEVAHAERPLAGLADDREGLGQHRRRASRHPPSGARNSAGLRASGRRRDSAAISGSSAFTRSTVVRSRAISRSLPSKSVLRKAIPELLTFSTGKSLLAGALGLGRQRYAKGRPFVLARLDRDRAVMHLDDLARDVKPDSGARDALVPRVAGPAEAREEAG